MPSREVAQTSSDELWPAQYLEAVVSHNNTTSRKSGISLVVLNSPLHDIKYFARLYDHASFRLCADGGANRLTELLANGRSESDKFETLLRYKPDIVHGDLDSLAPEVRQIYTELGVEISLDEDQYSTDFGKAIQKVIERQPETRDVLILGSLGGRVDQGLGLMHEFYREQTYRHPNIRLWLFSESSVSTLLRPGTTLIHTPVRPGLLARNIGIVPLYGPAIISTVGLEWDVEDWPTQLGGQVSTSNHITGDEIAIKTDREVLFTVERASD